VLAERYPLAKEILDFYQEILTFQKDIYNEISEPRRDRSKDLSLHLKNGLKVLFPRLPSLLCISREGPPLLSAMAKEVSSWGQMGWEALLEEFQQSTHREQPLFFFPRALLQPYLHVVGASALGGQHPLLEETNCPFCGHRPQVGYLRPLDNASQRLLICSFCNGEWPHDRLTCAGCAESDGKKLSYFVAEEYPAVRLDTCDTCGQYIKTIDLGKDPEAVPVVDELATIPLDIWAREKGYQKLELNLAGI
jgi:FdhE protein